MTTRKIKTNWLALMVVVMLLITAAIISTTTVVRYTASPQTLHDLKLFFEDFNPFSQYDTTPHRTFTYQENVEFLWEFISGK